MHVDVRVKNKFIFIIILSSIILSLFIILYKRKNISGLCGVYRADYKFAEEKLILDDRGNFTQEITIKLTGENAVAEGRWEYDAEAGYIDFDQNYLRTVNLRGDFDPEFKVPKKMIYIMPVFRFLGIVYIEMSENAGIWYKKANNLPAKYLMQFLNWL